MYRLIGLSAIFLSCLHSPIAEVYEAHTMYRGYKVTLTVGSIAEG